ncbi:ABC transporter permease [Gelidibacter salicanalis]|uniref:ABC transporter permease n=1 Tax=Gelidibacter salicanalis TaxID=291193 RepID=A0A934KWY6_9FLAO|nr:ABC transporter permease [Gelidibacter salicanalis]MBJ7881843.1 ABC transporter permease [Gelidibacter salicanalis]
MIQFKFIFRKLWRDRFFTFLKIIGLAIGIAVCLIIFKIVNYEFSFDKDHTGKEEIYQVVIWNIKGDKKSGFGGVQSAVAEFVDENFPEIDQVVPLNNKYYEYLSIEKPNGETYRKEDPKNIQSTVSDYFELVPYQWVAGDKNTALLYPNQVVLTQSKVEEYFGKVSADEIIGRTIKYGSTLFTVTGIVADLNFPSSFEGKEFIPITKEEKTDANWFSFNSNYNLFVKLQPNQKERLLEMLDEKYEEMIPDSWKNAESQTKYSLLPLSEKHFSQEFSTGAYSANKKIVFGLIGIGVFILLLAGINYINLSTAQIPYRTKEIGVRRTLGAKSAQLKQGFLYETLIISVLALTLASPLSIGFENFYGDFMPPKIGDYSDLLPISLFVVGLLLVLTFLTGLYPAYLINKVNVSEVLKSQGAGKLSVGNLNIRKTMIVFQFVIAQVFVIGAFIIASQIKYMINTELGFDKDAVITIKLPYKSYQNADVDPFLFKQALRKHPEIQQVSLGHTPMNNMHWGNNLVRITENGETTLNMNFKYVDADYVDLFEIEILAGRAPQTRDTVESVFINEAARTGLGFMDNEEAVGKTVKGSSEKPLIVQGIINDFYQKDLRNSKAPLSLMITTKKDMLNGFSVKLPAAPSEWKKTLGIVEKEWKTFYPAAPFAYEFYDTEIKQLYESDMRQSQMINLATIIIIILGCLGLIGLVTLTAYQRTKEIGIRKVLGSSVLGIIMLLSKDYLKLIGLAILISIPIAWWAMNKWLENFAYRIEIEWWMFVFTGIATILIALMAVSYRAIKAAIANPVKSLRTE